MTRQTNERHSFHCWLPGSMSAEVVTSIQRLVTADDVVHVAVMPDVHVSSDVCVGVAMATTERIYPAAVGNDPGCGMLAVQIDADVTLLDKREHAVQLLNRMQSLVPAIKHARRPEETTLPRSLWERPLSCAALESCKRRDGLWQFGTLGRGNHFVELQADEHDQLWLMIHSGSRGIGQAIARHHVQQMGASGGRLRSALADSALGQAYLSDLQWAVAYAHANRVAMANAIGDLFAEEWGVTPVAASFIHADHNHVRQENHFGRCLWVHRKGAQSAAADELGIIPGSMGTASYHVSGRGVADSLCSSSHGAGRALSRSQAASRIRPRQLSREIAHVWHDQRLVGRLCDEAPSAYKDIDAVMRAQHELTKIVRRLRPVLNYKGL